MAIVPANIKYYQCATWAQGDTQGGGIAAVEITSGADQNIFPDVTDADRIAGLTDYKKFYIKNENVDTWGTVVGWFSSLPLNTTYSMVIGSASDVESEVKTGGTAALTYVIPTNKGHADALALGSLAQNVYVAIWVKRVVAAGAGGETADEFTIKTESS